MGRSDGKRAGLSQCQTPCSPFPGLRRSAGRSLGSGGCNQAAVSSRRCCRCGYGISLILLPGNGQRNKSPKPFEIRAFRQKESTAILIRFVSKLRCFFGGPEEIRTLDPHNANQPPKLFSIISGHFCPFPLRFTSSLGLFDHAVSVWSGAVCGGFCGQKRSPALAGVFRRQGRGAFFVPLTACIVPLWTG